jgi:hypothetical protein
MTADRPKDTVTTDRFRQCLTCYAIFAPTLWKCPQCGSPWVANEREIRQVDGELVRIDPIAEAEAFHLEELKAAQEKRNKHIEVARADTLEALLGIAKQRGYNPKWAYRMWAIRQERRGGKGAGDRGGQGGAGQTNLFEGVV